MMSVHVSPNVSKHMCACIVGTVCSFCGDADGDLVVYFFRRERVDREVRAIETGLNDTQV